MSGRLDRLLKPRSLAFIGGAAAELAIDACRSLGFSGDMWAVNPGRELRGLPTVATVDDLPDGVDAAFVGVDCHATVDVVRRLAARGSGAAVCHASGFAETGEAGAALQDELVAAAGAMPVLGPNCYGLLSAPTGAALWPDVHGLVRTDRGVALLSQSGNIAVSLTMQRRGLDIAWVVTLGNQADVGISEVFEAMAADHAVSGVGLCIEALDDVERFAAAAATAHRRGVPVVALKLGATEASGAIAVTHTASLVGDDAAYTALFHRLGVARVHTLPELLDTLAILGVVGPTHGSRVVSLSCSGGEAALVADRGRARSLSFPSFAPEHGDRVASALDSRVPVSNPLDYHTFIWGDEDRLARCFGAVLGTDTASASPAPFDAALLVLDFPADGLDRSRWWPTLNAFAAACAASGTPGVVAASLAENLPEQARARAAELGLGSCGDIDTALAALEAAAAWGRHARMPGRFDSAIAPSPSPSSVSNALSFSLRRERADRNSDSGAESKHQSGRPYGKGVTCIDVAGVVALSESEAKRRLSACGVAVPAGVVVPAADAAVAAAGIGYPVVVKATGVAHKTESGGVVVGLKVPEAVAEAAGRLAGDGTSVLVESCVTGAAAELLVSVRSVPPIGMLLTLGAGGTMTELLDDTANLLLPAPDEEVRAALRSLRVWPALSGHRGRPVAAVDEVVAAVAALTALVRDDRSIIEVEINPLMVTPHAAVAADVLMVVAAPSPPTC